MSIIRPSNVFRDELVNEFVYSDAHRHMQRLKHFLTHAGQCPRVEPWTYKQTCHRAQTWGHTHHWHSSGVDSPPLKAKFISLNASSVLSLTPNLFAACHLLLLLLLFISWQLEENQVLVFIYLFLPFFVLSSRFFSNFLYISDISLCGLETFYQNSPSSTDG